MTLACCYGAATGVLQVMRVENYWVDFRLVLWPCFGVVLGKDRAHVAGFGFGGV